MNQRQKLEHVIELLEDEQLPALLDFAIFLKSKEKAAISMLQSQAYQEWLSAKNDVYDELFTDEISTG